MLTISSTDCKNLAPIWETLAEDFSLDEGVVIAKVDAESENSKGTAAAQGVSSYPTIKFFPKGSKEGEIYTGGRKEEDFIDFLNEKAGTARVPGGGLSPIAGTIAALDKIVAKYTSGTSLSDAAAEAKKEAETLKEQAQYKYAEYYVRVFDKLSKNDGYVKKEAARLDGILKKGGLAPAKRDEITSKTNILRKFLEKAEEKVADAKEEL